MKATISTPFRGGKEQTVDVSATLALVAAYDSRLDYTDCVVMGSAPASTVAATVIELMRCVMEESPAAFDLVCTALNTVLRKPQKLVIRDDAFEKE